MAQVPPGQSVGGPHSKPHGHPAWHPLPRTHSNDRLILGRPVHPPLAPLVLGRPGVQNLRDTNPDRAHAAGDSHTVV